MQTPILLFSKIQIRPDFSAIFFCVANKSLPHIHLATHSPTQFAEKNKFIRHDKLDWAVNKSRPICYFFEIQCENKDALPYQIQDCQYTKPIEWLLFPHAKAKLENGTHRNLLQLGVQYLSYGLIDESLIAAEYDEEWVKSELKKLDS
jgi:hypothetical protein